MKIKVYKTIESIEDIAIAKKNLSKRIAKQEIKISKSFKNIKQQSTAHNIYNEILSEFNLQETLFTIFPILLKYKDTIVDKLKTASRKNIMMILLGGILTGGMVYWLYKTNKSEKEPEEAENNTKEEV